MPECPECGEELHYVDYYGTGLSLDSFDRPRPGFVKTGDIYKCTNEDCVREGDSFHVLVGDDEVRDGYPC